MPINMKESIIDAYILLLEQKDINRITVKDLVETCAISRQSFYYHFRDMGAVLRSVVHRYLRAFDEGGGLAQAFAAMTRSADVHRGLWEKVMQYGDRAFADRAVQDELAVWLQELAENDAGLHMELSDAAVRIRFCAGGIWELLQDVAAHRADPAVQARRLSEIVRRTLA